MSEIPFRGSAIPPKRSNIIVHRVTTCETQQFTFVSPTLVGQQIHFAGRSSECLAPGTCPGCSAGHPKSWKAYLHAIDQATKTEIILELTAQACYQIHAQTGKQPDGAPVNWAGLQVRIRKTKGGPKGRYLIEVLERKIDWPNLPVEKDVIAILRPLWNARKFRCDPA